jgi:glycine cleavage system H protein
MARVSHKHREEVMSPDDLLYSKEHEWLRLTDAVGTVGITDHAQEELGEVVYVELPKVGDRFDSGDTFGTVESVKAVSELFMPVSAEVVEVNEELGNAPENVNTDPYGKGWMIRIRIRDANETGQLMSAKAYDEYIAEKE